MKGLGNDECSGFWCRLKNKVKNRLTVISGALLTGNFGAAALIVLSSAFEAAVGWRLNFESDYDPTPSEQSKLDKWNDVAFSPFMLKIEQLIIGSNSDKNTALKLMAIYEAFLFQQIKNEEYFKGISMKAATYRVAYVQSVFDDVRATLTTTPSIKTQVMVDDYLDQMLEVSDDFMSLPYSVEVELLSENTAPVDVNVNLPHIPGPKKGTVVALIRDDNPVKGSQSQPQPQPGISQTPDSGKKNNSAVKFLGKLALFTGIFLVGKELVSKKSK